MRHAEPDSQAPPSEGLIIAQLWGESGHSRKLYFAKLSLPGETRCNHSKERRVDNSTPYTRSSYDQQVRKTLPHDEITHQDIMSLAQAVKPGCRISRRVSTPSDKGRQRHAWGS